MFVQIISFSNEAHFKSVVLPSLLFVRNYLTMVFTFTSVPLNLYSSVSGCGCGFGFEQNYWRIDGFVEKRHGSADLHTPIHPPLRLFTNDRHS